MAAPRTLRGDKCKQFSDTWRWIGQVDELRKALEGGIRTSGGGLPSNDLNVTVSAAPNGSGLEMTICMYSRDRVQGKSENEEREFRGPRRGRGHNMAARSAGKRGLGPRRSVVAYVRLGRACAAERKAKGGRNERAGGRAVRYQLRDSGRSFGGFLRLKRASNAAAFHSQLAVAGAGVVVVAGAGAVADVPKGGWVVWSKSQKSQTIRNLSHLSHTRTSVKPVNPVNPIKSNQFESERVSERALNVSRPTATRRPRRPRRPSPRPRPSEDQHSCRPQSVA